MKNCKTHCLLRIYCNDYYNSITYTCISPFYDYRYWPTSPLNKDACEYKSYVQFIWATDLKSRPIK